MTRRRIFVLASLLALSFSVVSTHHASAAPRGSDKTRFYDFDDLLIDGEFNKPTTVYTRALKSPRFDRLLRLQKSFLEQLGRTSQDPGLRWFR